MKRIRIANRTTRILLTLIALAAGTTSLSCAAPSRKSDVLVKASAEKTAEPAALATESHEVLREIEKDILETDADMQPQASAKPGDSHSPRIPLEINEDVRRWISFFSVTDRARFQRFLLRGEKYREIGRAHV